MRLFHFTPANHRRFIDEMKDIKMTTNNTQYKLIRIKSVMEMTGLSKSYTYQLQNEGLFPQSVQIVPNGKAKAWVYNEVQDWIESRILARDESLMEVV